MMNVSIKQAGLTGVDRMYKSYFFICKLNEKPSCVTTFLVGGIQPMEDHITSSGQTGPGNSSVTVVTNSLRTYSDLLDLCSRVKVLEQRTGSVVQFDSYMWNR